MTGLPLDAVTMVIAGAGATLYAFVARSRAAAIQRWPVAEGTIYASRVVAETDRDADGHGPTLYRPEVQYSFVVDGKEYASKRIAVGTISLSLPAHAERVAARYPQGRSVLVYYNPERPGDAVLDRASAPAWANGLLVVGLLLAAAGLLWWYVGSTNG